MEPFVTKSNEVRGEDVRLRPVRSEARSSRI